MPPLEKLDKNYLLSGVSHAEAMINPENVMKAMDNLANSSSHPRGESVFSAIGDMGPNLAISAMSKLRETPSPSLPPFSLENK